MWSIGELLGFNKDDEEDDVIGAEANDAEAEYIRYVNDIALPFPSMTIFEKKRKKES